MPDMVNRIAFKDIDVSSDGVLRCAVTRETTEDFWVELPYSFEPSVDLIAAAFASLCGTAFEVIEIDLPVGPLLAQQIELATQSKLIHQSGTDIRRLRGSSQALNFSGGFDSLAARIMMPNAHLVSLDFGGRFSRERRFFERFDPLIFSTNLVDLKLNRYAWTFMGLGTTLLRDELDLRSYSFGSIQAGSLPRLFSRPLDQSTMGLTIANSLGMVNENSVAGISEIGAIQVVARRQPGILLDALTSVALPDEDKFQRKHQMLETVSNDLALPLQLPDRTSPKTKPTWGESFARDLASIFVAKRQGPDGVANSYAQGLPSYVVERLEVVNVTFMERFNPHAYRGVKPDILAGWYAHLIMNEVIPYERQDWFDAANVMKLLRGQL